MGTSLRYRPYGIVTEGVFLTMGANRKKKQVGRSGMLRQIALRAECLRVNSLTPAEKQAELAGMLRQIANEQSKKQADLRAESALVNNLTPQEKQAWLCGILRDLAAEGSSRQTVRF